MIHQAPTRPEERIDVIDIIRGFVLFGVLVINTQWFSGPPVANPNTADAVLKWLTNSLFSDVSMSTFSLLFGLGLAMQCDKTKGSSFIAFQIRRQAALFFIGALHVALLWDGDVLMFYAITAVVLLPFLKVSQKTLAICSAALFTLWCLNTRGILWLPSWFTWQHADPIFNAAQTMTSVYAHGTWLQVAKDHIRTWALAMEYLPYLTRNAAFFLAGVFIWRRGFIQAPSKHRRTIQAVLRCTLWPGLGVILTTGLLQLLIPRPVLVRWFGAHPAVLLLILLLIPLMALGYVFGILHLFQKPLGRKLLSFLAPIGRMALTNYLLQSAVAGVVFYGWGFGRWGLWHVWQITLYAVILFAFQGVFSRWWLGQFRFGPVEWLWRSMTYGARQPFRRQDSKAYESSAFGSTPGGGASFGA